MISTPFDLSGSPSARSCQAGLARIPLSLIIVLVIHWSPVLPGYVCPLPMLYSALSSVSLPNTRFCLQRCWHKWSYNLAGEHSFFFNASYVNMQFYLVNFCIPTLNSSHSFYYDKFHWKTNHWFYYNMKYLLKDRQATEKSNIYYHREQWKQSSVTLWKGQRGHWVGSGNGAPK